ncbi:MAG: hypothetical protein KGI38_12060 [Thaumarchaeota archaeon]|nr:hypothetical protein [Nitrososphaerota archaeon]
MAQSKQNGKGPLSKVGGGNEAKFLRLYIPKAVSDALDLKAGDVVRWAVVQEDGKPIAKIHRVKLIVQD